LKSLYQLQQVDDGIQRGNVITMSTDLPASSYATPDQAVRFYREVVEKLEAAPGVEHAAISTDLPLQRVRQGQGVNMPGREGGMTVEYKRIDPNYVEAFGIALLAG